MRKQFGDEKATLVDEFLLLQARLGIKRKTLDKLPDEKMRAAVEKEMADIREKMEEKRRQVGSYVMVVVRNIFPEGSSLLRGIMKARMQQRAEEGSPKTTMFASLEQRMSAAKAGSESTGDQ